MEWTEIVALSEVEILCTLIPYMLRHGYDAQKINTDNLPQNQQAPDLEVKLKGKPYFYSN